MASLRYIFMLSLGFLFVLYSVQSDAAVLGKTLKRIAKLNRNGPYMGLVIPNSFEMNPLLQSPSFQPNESLPYVDFAGRRFRLGTIEGEKVILVMTGLAMLNAGVTTQLLLALFKVKGVVHYGIAGNANPDLNIGDVTIPQFWAHTGLWNWQRYGDGPEDELPLESNGDYTRKIGYLHFADYSIDDGNKTLNTSENLLNNVWYQPEEVFPINGIPETRGHAFWVPVNSHYFALSNRLENLKLKNCINSTTCLSSPPVVKRVARGSSSSIFVDNAAYRSFIYNKFNISPIDMESAAVALVCHQQKTPFIVFRALSDLAGGGEAQSNEASIFASLAANNSVTVVVQFLKHLLLQPYFYIYDLIFM
ncbi:hypothetical protein AMTRI_Chr05g57240 [Amborella trichopoda]